MAEQWISALAAAALCISAAGQASAATWRATGGSVDGRALSAGNAVFSDGMFTPTSNDAVLIGGRYPNGVPNDTYMFQDWHTSGALSYMQAPEVDLMNMRANFSSLVVIGHYDNGTAAIGWEVGAHDWVPISRNPDGSYTAAWLTPDPVWVPWGGGSTFSFSFAPVPEPASILFLAVGLPLLLVAARKRNR